MIAIDGHALKLKDVEEVARSSHPLEVQLHDRAREKLKEVRSYIESHWLLDDAPPIYGFNTGVGPLKDIRISPEENLLFQERLIESHCAGTGDPAPEEILRGTMLIRANALAQGVSGIRPEVIDRLLSMLNKGVHPFIPIKGSVGASGDLAPLSHLVATLVGHPKAWAFYQEERLPAREALGRAGLDPTFTMEAKDVLAMINGCSFSLAYGALALIDARDLLLLSNLATALSLEAIRGEMKAFDHRIQQARNQKGQERVARHIREILQGSEWVTDRARRICLPHESREGEWQPRVQDAYSFRCAPQVHGNSYDLLSYAQDILERELNAATDNPLIFEKGEGEGYEALSGGNFHGQYLSSATDILAMAAHELGSISERRSARLLEPTLSFGLPPNLSGGSCGLDSGFPVFQCAAAALVMENRTLCGPTSIDSIPTKRNQEDHVSMSTWSGRKAREVVENTRSILMIEILMACQGISLMESHLKGLSQGEITKRALSLLRERVPMVEEDSFLYCYLEEAKNLFSHRSLLSSMRKELALEWRILEKRE